jgi:preprotein translocase subunit SecY
MTLELVRRVAFTLGALLVYIVGLHIPLPGVDAAAWKAIFDMQSGGMLGQANALSGGALRTLSILSLAITPYVTAAVILRLLSLVAGRLRAVVDDGERGRILLERYTIATTVFLVALQSYGIAVGLEGVGPLVPAPGLVFRLTTMLTLTAGTLFLVWLAGQITARGIGNGVALLVAAGIVNGLPREIATLLVGIRQGVATRGTLLLVVLVVAAMTALVVVVERSRRRIAIEFAERHVGAATLPRQTGALALKLNPAGIMPTYLAVLLLDVIVVAAFLAALAGAPGGIADQVRVALSYGTVLHLVLTAALLALFTFVYTAFTCDPDQMAARLAACGGALPGVAPGEATAAHLDRTISRTAAFGAAYLVVVLLLPEVLAIWFELSLPVGGLSILVLVCVVLDLAAEVRGYLTVTP